MAAYLVFRYTQWKKLMTVRVKLVKEKTKKGVVFTIKNKLENKKMKISTKFG